MPLVFAAICPHPPLLIPNIGKNDIKEVEKTKLAMEQLEQDLYITKPDIIMVISPHASLFFNSFVVNSNTNFISNFAQFGDLSTNLKWQGAVDLGTQISHMGRQNNIPVQMISQKNLDHGTTVPLYFLTKHLDNVKVISIGFCGLDSKTHFQFGELLKEIIMSANSRIAVIASGDLSHGLTTDAPAGYSQVGKTFDEKLIQLLEAHNTAGILGFDPVFVEQAAECGYRSFLILLGILKNMNYQFKNYSYQGPFGVGYLVGNFIL